MQPSLVSELKQEMVSSSNRTRTIFLLLAVLPPSCGAFTLPSHSIKPAKMHGSFASEASYNVPLCRHLNFRSDVSRPRPPIENRPRRATSELFSGKTNDSTDGDQINNVDGCSQINGSINGQSIDSNSHQNAGAKNDKAEEKENTPTMNDELSSDNTNNPGAPSGLTAKEIAEKLKKLEEMKSSLLARKEERKNERIVDETSSGNTVSEIPRFNQREETTSDSDKSTSSSRDEGNTAPSQSRTQLLADIDEKEAWIQEQNRLVEERRLARLEMEKQMKQQGIQESSVGNASSENKGDAKENPSPKQSNVKNGNYDFNYYDITQNFRDARRPSRNVLTDIVSGRAGDRIRLGSVEVNEFSGKGTKKEARKEIDELYFDITKRVYPHRPSLSTAKNVGVNQEPRGTTLPSGVSLESTLGIPSGRAKMSRSSDEIGSISEPSTVTNTTTRIMHPTVQIKSNFKNPSQTASPVMEENTINASLSPASESTDGVESRKRTISKIRRDEDSTISSQQYELEEKYFDITRNKYPDRQSLSEGKKYDSTVTSRNRNDLSSTSTDEAFFDITQNEFTERPSLSNFAGGMMASEGKSAQPKRVKTQSHFTSNDAYYDITQNSFPDSPSLAAARRAEAASTSSHSLPPVTEDYFYDITRKLIPERRSLSTTRNAGATLSESAGRIREFRQNPVKENDTQYFDITRTNIPSRSSMQHNTTPVGKSTRKTESTIMPSQKEAHSSTIVSPPIDFGGSSKPESAPRITPFVIPKSAIRLEKGCPEAAEKTTTGRSVFRVMKKDENVDVPQAFVSNPNPNASSKEKKPIKTTSKASGVDVPRAFASNPAESFKNMKNKTTDEKDEDSASSSKYLDIPTAFVADPKDSFHSKKGSSREMSDRDSINASTKYVDIPKAFFADPAASISNIKNFTLPNGRNDNAEGSRKYVDTPAAFYANPAKLFSNIKNASEITKSDARVDPDIPGAFKSNPASLVSNSSGNEEMLKRNEMKDEFLVKPQFAERSSSLSTPSPPDSTKERFAVRKVVKSGNFDESEFSYELSKHAFSKRTLLSLSNPSPDSFNKKQTKIDLQANGNETKLYYELSERAFSERSSLSLSTTPQKSLKESKPRKRKGTEESYHDITQDPFVRRSTLSEATPSPLSLAEREKRALELRKKERSSTNSFIDTKSAADGKNGERVSNKRRSKGSNEGGEEYEYTDITKRSFGKREVLSLATPSSVPLSVQEKRALEKRNTTLSNSTDSADSTESFTDITKKTFGARGSLAEGSPTNVSIAERDQRARVLKGSESTTEDFIGTKSGIDQGVSSTSSEAIEEAFVDITKTFFGDRKSPSLSTPRKLSLTEQEKRSFGTNNLDSGPLKSKCVKPEAADLIYYDITQKSFNERRSLAEAKPTDLTLEERDKRARELKATETSTNDFIGTKSTFVWKNKTKSRSEKRKGASSSTNNEEKYVDITKDSFSRRSSRSLSTPGLLPLAEQEKRALDKKMSNTVTNKSQVLHDEEVTRSYHDKETLQSVRASDTLRPSTMTLDERERRARELKGTETSTHDFITTKSSIKRKHSLEVRKNETSASNFEEEYIDITKDSFSRRSSRSLATPSLLPLAEQEKRGLDMKKSGIEPSKPRVRTRDDEEAAQSYHDVNKEPFQGPTVKSKPRGAGMTLAEREKRARELKGVETSTNDFIGTKSAMVSGGNRPFSGEVRPSSDGNITLDDEYDEENSLIEETLAEIDEQLMRLKELKSSLGLNDLVEDSEVFVESGGDSGKGRDNSTQLDDSERTEPDFIDITKDSYGKRTSSSLATPSPLSLAAQERRTLELKEKELATATKGRGALIAPTIEDGEVFLDVTRKKFSKREGS